LGRDELTRAKKSVIKRQATFNGRVIPKYSIRFCTQAKLDISGTYAPQQSPNPLPAPSALDDKLSRHSNNCQDKAPQGQASGRKVIRLPAHSRKQVLALETENGWHNHKTWLYLIRLENIMNSLYFYFRGYIL